MEYPHSCSFKVPNIYGEELISIELFSGVTTFVGANASGKTQTLKSLRDHLRQEFGDQCIRYLSSNRIGTMETYRSRVNHYTYSIDDFSIGSHDEKKHRLEIETATGDFFTLDEKKDVFIKVAERLSVMFKRQIYLRWNSGNLQVFFEKTETQEEYSVVAEASGLVNIISILAALFDKDVKVLLIDEPEVSLHPQLQSYLLRELKKATQKYGKTIVLSTHSPEMIHINSIQDICSMVFFSEKESPKQINPSTPELDNRKLKDFILRIGQIYKTGFFANRVLLIEGSSDMIMCRYLQQKMDINIDVAGSQIIPIDGKGQFSVIARLFRLVGKDVALLSDLDGFIDNNSVVDLFTALPGATESANSHGSASLSDMVRTIKSDIFQRIESDKESLVSIYDAHPYWMSKTESDDINLVIRRAVVAQLYNLDFSCLQNWPNADIWISLRTRLDTLFSSLESLGCFFSKKGALESYYHFAKNTEYNEKTSAAATETGEMEQKEVQFIQDNYRDIIRPLEYIALTERVDESIAVKKELLSELALVLGVLPDKSKVNELYSAIKQTKGSAESIFNYDIIERNKNKGVRVSLKTGILEVSGFPFDAFIGQNVNAVVEETIHP